MNDLVLEGFVNNFAETRGLRRLRQDELFEAFVASAVFRKYHQCDITDIDDDVLVDGGGDGGLDAVGILVNGRLTRTEEDVQFFADNLRRLDVEFVFIQAKSASSFKAADIGSFVFGVEQFFSAVMNADSKVQFNVEIQQLIELTRYIYHQSIKMQQNPNCFLYYATTGEWKAAPDPQGRISYGQKQLVDMNIFHNVSITPVDAEHLKSIYRELERAVVKDVEFSKAAVFPRIDGVDDAYIGLLPGDEFIKLVSTDDGDLNRELFYDNVRDFQGNNPVNSEISHTLGDDQLRHNYPLLNNGVTIVARSINRKGDIFTISDFQVVNGCQTTHIIFQNKSNISSETYIPIKLLATTNSQVVTDVIKATNRQTAVLPEALESLTPFHKELEDFYRIQESHRELSDRIYYERRSKQYSLDNISPRNIVSLTGQIKSFVGMFLNEPHSHPRYYGELLKSYVGRLFDDDHRPEPYYASGIALITLERWLDFRPDHRELRPYKHQLLMLLRVLVSGQILPRFNSNAISEYSMGIVNVLRDPEHRDQLCGQATEILRSSLENFVALNGGRPDARQGNPPHRLRAFTEQLIRDLGRSEPVAADASTQKEPSLGEIGFGRIISYDDWKNYGFIERDAGGGIFVHQSEMNAIPWHLRVKGMRVRYTVVQNPRSPERLMAGEVSLEAIQLPRSNGR